MKQSVLIFIKERKQKLIDKNNQMENNKRRKYTYEVGQKVLVKLNHSRKFGDNPYKGPYEVVALEAEVHLTQQIEQTPQ